MQTMSRIILVLILTGGGLGLLASGIPEPEAQDPELLFQRAVQLETIEGDLDAAIDLYKQVVEKNGNHRSLAAKALLRLAGCYEKLGQEEAQKTYERLIAEYPEQQEEVRTAQAKLAAMGADSQQAAGVTIRKLGPFGGGSVSADGRYLGAISGENVPVNAAVVDLVAGKKWNVTDYDGKIEGVEWPVLVSPDGKRLAFTHYTRNAGADIRIVGSDGTGERVVLESDDIGGWFMCLAWSPDGKYLAVYEEKRDSTQYVLVSVDDGEVRVIRTSFSWFEGLGFSPDGRFLAYSPAAVGEYLEDGPQQSDVYIQPVSGGQEVAIAAHPANDGFIAWAPNGDILFTSDRAGSIGLYGIAVEDGRQSGEPRLLQDRFNIGEPLGITDAGSLHYAADRAIRNSYFASIDFSTGRVLSEPEKISDRFDDSTSMPSWSPDGRYLSYLVHRPGDATPTVMIREIASGEERELLSDAVLFKDNRCRILWHADGKSLLALGRKDDETGLLRINAATGEVSLVAPVSWRAIGTSTTEWTPDAKWLFYTGGPLRPGIIRRNVETGEEQTIYSREGRERGVGQGFRISPDGKFLVLVNGSALGVVPTSGGEYREVFTGKFPNYERFALSRAWTNDSRHILFVHQGRLWVVPAEGGEARATEIEGRIMAISFNPNSDRFAYSTLEGTTEYWVMENFLPESQVGE